MRSQLKVHNTFTRQKELFIPFKAPFVGMYVCGPTVYGQSHLGHARSAISFDIIFRYLKHLGYQVRYVRNITDVGHLEGDADAGVDKIEKQAHLEALEPMEVVQRYTNSYHRDMALLNVQAPSIEPRASGHILEQITMIQQIIKAGLGYETGGSVYFNVEAYHKTHNYGKLSGRVIEDMLTGTRPLSGQQGKHNPLDFALWKKAAPAHLMRWPSPWGEGFPGWHIECSAIAHKYLGAQFDIHGGGMDLLFPHHECELAQAKVAFRAAPAKYWLHNNLIMIDGQKMGKSLGNAITLEHLFQGTHSLLDQAYSPMTLRFFMLQAHYRSTLSFSNEALQAAQRGYRKLMNGLRTIKTLSYPEDGTEAIDQALATQVQRSCDGCYEAMNDDFNTAQVIAALFSLLKTINALKNRQLSPQLLGPVVFGQLKNVYVNFVEDILGLRPATNIPTNALLDILLSIYRQAKAEKQYGQVDAIRGQLQQLGIVVQDTPAGVQWDYVCRD
ncbi:MAG: cysteine--tRNA ligase [Bacteroidota bacterium]